MRVCRLPVHIGPPGSCGFAADSHKNRCILRADRVVRPYGVRGERISAVGADDSVGPKGSYEFAVDYRKNAAFCAGRCDARRLVSRRSRA